MSTSVRADDRRHLSAIMNYCPVCGSKLFDFGGSSSDRYKTYRTCVNRCGLLSVISVGEVNKPGMFFEEFCEDDVCSFDSIPPPRKSRRKKVSA